MDKLAKPKNRALFLISVAVTGALAGAAVWLFFLRWNTASISFGPRFRTCWVLLRPSLPAVPSVVCRTRFSSACWAVCSLVCTKRRTGTKTDDLNQVMAKVKQDGRYPYDNLGKLLLAALLPLLFGGSIGPEAGLTGVIAGLSTSGLSTACAALVPS